MKRPVERRCPECGEPIEQIEVFRNNAWEDEVWVCPNFHRTKQPRKYSTAQRSLDVPRKAE